MKILITSQGPTLDSAVDPRFGRAGFFIIYDSSIQKAVEVIENPYAGASGGAGTAAAQLAVEKGVQAVVSGAFGPNASMVLSGAGIQMLQAPSGISVNDAIRMALSGELQPIGTNPQFPQQNPGFGGPGFGRGGGFGRGRGGGKGGGFGRGGGFGGGGKGGGFGRGGGRGRGGGFGGGWGNF